MFHYSMLAGGGASGMDQAGMNCSFASKQASITLEYIVKREECSSVQASSVRPQR
jgi:hypothetical protein